MNTVGDFIKSGSIDIVPILTLVLRKSVASLISHSDYQLNNIEITKLYELVDKRAKGVPFAYLNNKKGFYHLEFIVTEATLIPRPETELLVDIALKILDKDSNYEIVDLGTGSGVIAVTLADIRPNWNLTATDLSVFALEVAKKNKTKDINFLHGYWLDAVGEKKFDMIVCNPPYIAEKDPHLKELTFEPISALTSGTDGLDDIKAIIKKAPEHLNKNGYLLLEHGHDQQAEVVKLLRKDFNNIKRFNDYSNIERAVLAKVKK